MMHEMLQHQRVQTDLLQHLLLASGISVPRPPSLDENKTGQKVPLPSPVELVARIPHPYYTLAGLKARKENDSIKAKLDHMTAARAQQKQLHPLSLNSHIIPNYNYNFLILVLSLFCKLFVFCS